MRQKSEMLVIWPQYLDAKLSRSEGRRIPKNLAAPDINLKILQRAAESAGFNYEIHSDKHYPRNPISKIGYIVVENPEGHKKTRVLLMLAKGVRRVVAQRDAAQAVAKKKKTKKTKRRK